MAVIQIIVNDDDQVLNHLLSAQEQLGLSSRSSTGIIALKRGLNELARLGFIKLELDTGQAGQVEPGVSKIGKEAI